jgi:hypothetical protein
VNLGPADDRTTNFNRSANLQPMLRFPPAGTKVNKNCGEK